MLAHSPIAGAKNCNLLRHSPIFFVPGATVNVQYAYEGSDKVDE